MTWLTALAILAGAVFVLTGLGFVIVSTIDAAVSKAADL